MIVIKNLSPEDEEELRVFALAVERFGPEVDLVPADRARAWWRISRIDRYWEGETLGEGPTPQAALDAALAKHGNGT